MNNEIILAIEIGITIFVLFILIPLYGSCKVSGKCSRKEEQEEAKRKLSGKEYMLDDYRIEDDLVYDDEFVKKADHNEK